MDSSNTGDIVAGQGGNSAFESAAAVVDAFKDCPGDFIAALGLYEKRRKPRADLVQRYANLMGCFQATGKEVLSRDSRTAVDSWVKLSLPVDDLKLSDEEYRALLEFDPCLENGVTKLDL